MSPTHCPSMSFRTAVQSDGRRLYQCTHCFRVARTERRHKMRSASTKSHDRTMEILWEHSTPEPRYTFTCWSCFTQLRTNSNEELRLIYSRHNHPNPEEK